MKVSIVIPVYNVEKYVGATLRSVQNQTMTDFEAIIINDGSTDNSVKMVEPFLSDKRFKLFSIENRGLAGARNEGLKHVTGEYLYFLDSDDLIAPNFLEIMVNEFDNHVESQLITFNNVDVYEQPESLKFAKIINKQQVNRKELLMLLFNRKLAMTAWSYFVKTNVFKDGGVEFPEGRLFEDESTTIRLFGITEQATWVLFSKENPAYLYRKNRLHSIMDSFKSNPTPKAIEDRLYYIELQYEVYKKNIKFKDATDYYLQQLLTCYREEADSLKVNYPKEYILLRKSIIKMADNFVLKNKIKLTSSQRWKYLKVKYDLLRKLSQKVVKIIGK